MRRKPGKGQLHKTGPTCSEREKHLEGGRIGGRKREASSGNSDPGKGMVPKQRKMNGWGRLGG